MKLLVSSCARLFKTPDGEIYTPVAYGYDFYRRYLNVFESVEVMGFCKNISFEEAKSMLKVTGENVSVCEITYPNGEWDYIRKRGTIKKEVHKAVDRSDVLLLRVPETICFLAMDRAIKKKIPFAIEVTSDPLNLYKKDNCPSKYRLVYKIYYYLQLRRASYYATGTSYVTQYELQKHYPPNLKKANHFTSFYTDTNISIPKEMTIRKLHKYKKIRFIHISVSVGGFAKGHKEAIECISKLVNDGLDVELTFVGEGELADSNRKFIENNNLTEHIRFTGKLDYNGVIKELEDADIFLFPSYNEGLPRVVIEAMSRALPVIASDIPAHRELLEKECLSPVKDSDGLYKIAKKMISDESFYYEVSNRNIKKVREYDISIIENKRNDFYQKLYDVAKERLNNNGR